MDLFSARKILLCLRYGIGDVVMQTPVLEVLRNSVSATIQGLGSQPALQLLEHDPRLDELINVQEFGFSHWADTGNPDTKTRIRNWISRNDHDLILNVADAVEAVRWIMWDSKGPKFDVHSDAIHRYLRVGVNGTRAMNMATGLGWGLDVPADIRPRLFLPPEVHHFADRFIRQEELTDARLIGISPVASSPLKRWPMEKMGHLIDRLADTMDCKFLVFSGPELELGEMLASHVNIAALEVVGPLHLSKIAALQSQCAIFISNDTGLMHMAAAVGTPTVGIFGPTSPLIYLPPFEHALAVRTPEVECCYRKTQHMGPPGCWGSAHCLIAESSCIDQVETEEVYRTVLTLLSGSLNDHSSQPWGNHAASGRKGA